MSKIKSFLQTIRNKIFGVNIINNRLVNIEHQLTTNSEAMKYWLFKLENAENPRSEVSSHYIGAGESARTEPNMVAILMRVIALGKSGILKLVPMTMTLGVTTKCNLKCIMCAGHSFDYSVDMTIDDVKILLNSLKDNDRHFDEPFWVDLTAGEPTLNSDLGLIFEYVKKKFPDVTINTITNATLPIKGNLRTGYRYVDRVGISIDGATAKTFEQIRKGASFKNVINNVKEIISIKQEIQTPPNIIVLFVAMDLNILELPDLVRLVHSLGISKIFVQESEDRQSPFNFENQNTNLTLPDSELAPILIAAKEVADQLCIDLAFGSRLASCMASKNSDEMLPPSNAQRKPATDIQCFKYMICSGPWFNAPMVYKSPMHGFFSDTPCCHMPHLTKISEMIEHPEFQQGKSLLDIFNSSTMWDIRLGLLDGTLSTTACEGCQYYTHQKWSDSSLLELEEACDRAEAAYLCR